VRFDALVDENFAVWAPLRLLAGVLETIPPDVFAADYHDRLDRASPTDRRTPGRLLSRDAYPKSLDLEFA